MDPFIGQIMMVGFNFAPRGWALCNGQLLSVASNTALFSLLGTTYGGDGRTTFGLPDLRGRCAVGMGHGPGLTDRRIGAELGSETVTLNQNELPSHTHQLMGNNTDATTNDPTNSSLAKDNVVVERGGDAIPVNSYVAGAASVPMGASISNAGGNQAHNNMQPFLVTNYIIALQGVFPSRS